MEKMEILEVKDLSKIFRLQKEKKTTLYDNLSSIIRRKFEYEKLCALNNINFSLQKGDSLGIIGPNAAGKSVLLKIIAKILRQTSGKIIARGKIVPLLELGTGFQDELTARENIYLYGTILGLKKNEIEKKFDSIVEFAGIERFVDVALKNFSSGMKLRLAFAVAREAMEKADLLLIDEVLAVGDAAFREKCIKTFYDLKKQGKTVVFATHDMKLVRELCEKALLLKEGKQLAFDNADAVIKIYENSK